MSDPTAPVEGTPDNSSAPESAPAADPWAPVSDRVGELAGTVGDLAGRFDQFLQSQQPEPEPEASPWENLFQDEQVDEYGQPIQAQPQLDPQALQSAFQQALAQATAPMQQQMQEMQWARDREALYSEIPQLRDPAVAKQTGEAFNAFLQQSGAPDHVASWLINSPQAIGNFFKAAEAQKFAQGQAPASEQVPQLEAAGGAVPGGNGEQPNYIQAAHNGAWSLPPGLR